MSHRKAYSEGSIPFSWEHKPGVSKVPLQVCPTNIGMYALNLTPTLPSCHSNSPEVLIQDRKIPLPPCRSSQPQRKRTSKKGLWKQDDPFLAAYKECVKRVEIDPELPSGERKKGGVGTVRKNKFNFSCIQSCDVRDDNLVRLTHLPPLPPLPRDRSWRVK